MIGLNGDRISSLVRATRRSLQPEVQALRALCWLIPFFFFWLSGLVSLTASAGTTSFRADPDYLIDTWEAEDGRPGSAAYTMAQSLDGYLWVGTLEGLVRFDGVEFRLFDQASLPSWPSPAATKLQLDRSGKLWAGTTSGVAVRSGTDWHAVALSGTNTNRGSHVVRSLAERAGGDLLVTTHDGGVMEFHDGAFHALLRLPAKRTSITWASLTTPGVGGWSSTSSSGNGTDSAGWKRCRSLTGPISHQGRWAAHPDGRAECGWWQGANYFTTALRRGMHRGRRRARRTPEGIELELRMRGGFLKQGGWRCRDSRER